MKPRLLSIFQLVLVGLMISSTANILWAQEDTVLVKITDPSRDGVEVKKGMTVKGTAIIPRGCHLWAMVRRSDFTDVWWPQAEGKIDPKTNEWKVSVTFGQAEDVGWDFNIAVFVVKGPEHIILQNYRIKAMKDGDWKPIEAPPSVCPPQIRTVKKVGHN